MPRKGNKKNVDYIQEILNRRKEEKSQRGKKYNQSLFSIEKKFLKRMENRNKRNPGFTQQEKKNGVDFNCFMYKEGG